MVKAPSTLVKHNECVVCGAPTGHPKRLDVTCKRHTTPSEWKRNRAQKGEAKELLSDFANS